MIKKLKINDWLVLGIIALILISGAFAIGVNSNKTNASYDKINLNINENKFENYTKVDACYTGCNVMDFEYTQDYNIDHSNDNEDILEIVDRIESCYVFCEESY